MRKGGGGRGEGEPDMSPTGHDPPLLSYYLPTTGDSPRLADSSIKPVEYTGNPTCQDSPAGAPHKVPAGAQPSLLCCTDTGAAGYIQLYVMVVFVILGVNETLLAIDVCHHVCGG